LSPRRDRKPADPRHAAVKTLLATYWANENPDSPDLPWGPADAGALAMLLRADPKLDTLTVARCLRHRLESDDHAAGERVYVWIGNLLRYRYAPLDRYRLPKRTCPEALVGMTTGTSEGIEAPERAQWIERARKRRAQGQPLADWEAQLLREAGDL
jgi:hypothetical protein